MRNYLRSQLGVVKSRILSSATGFMRSSSKRWSGPQAAYFSTDKIQVNVVIPQDKRTLTLYANNGDTFRDLAESNSELAQFLECACGGNAACSTCQVIVSPEDFDRLEPVEDFEMDMLDLAYDPQPTSRLGCQIFLDSSHHGLKVEIPKGVNNLH